MRLWLRLLLLLFVLVGAGAGAWCYLNWQRLVRQSACYRVGVAPSFKEAQAEIAWFETGRDREAKLRELLRKWGTGNRQFDLYLAQHVGHAKSTEALREAFSLELAWREELVPRWAHYWSWRAPLEPDEQIASIIEYLDDLAAAETPKKITWREVLDLQAVFHLTGYRRLAHRLTPENWHERYRRWSETRPAKLPHITRPAKPFPDWQGPLPKERFSRL